MIAHKELPTHGEGFWSQIWSHLRERACNPGTFAALILLCIASLIIARPEMPFAAQEFFMILFACTALLPDKTPSQWNVNNLGQVRALCALGPRAKTRA